MHEKCTFCHSGLAGILLQPRFRMAAIYHSHTSSDAYPSPKDVSLAFYEDSFYLIVSLIHEELVFRAFEIKDGTTREIEVIIKA